MPTEGTGFYSVTAPSVGWGEGKEGEEANVELQRVKLFQGQVGNVAVEKQRQEEEKMGQDLGDR